MDGKATCACSHEAASEPERAPSLIYVVGQIEARPATPGVQKELAQVAAGFVAKDEASSSLHAILADPKHRYLARNFQWVLRVGGVDTYLLSPRDPADFALLLEAIASDLTAGMHVVLGGTGAADGVGGAGPLRTVFFEQIYSFTREAFSNALAGSASPAAINHVLTLARNRGASPGARALNYLIVRYPGIYATVEDRRTDGWDLSAVETHAIDGQPGREVMEILFVFERGGAGVERHAARVDVTELFPFLVSDLTRHVRVGPT